MQKSEWLQVILPTLFPDYITRFNIDSVCVFQINKQKQETNSKK